jgi:hypothetical protein
LKAKDKKGRPINKGIARSPNKFTIFNALHFAGATNDKSKPQRYENCPDIQNRAAGSVFFRLGAAGPNAPRTFPGKEAGTRQSVAGKQGTAEQDPKFDEISTRYFQEFRAIKTGNDGVTEKFNKVRDSQIRKDAEMQKLLTPDQYQLYLQIQQERRDRMQGKR